MKECQVEDVQKSLDKSFQSLFEEQELLAKVIEFFPYPIQIFSLDGTARMINKATLDMMGIKSCNPCGQYNVLKIPRPWLGFHGSMSRRY
jgi:hypothetical protein